MREMKDSGVAWIGRIPATWRTLTIGSLFKVRNEKVNDTDYLPLSVTKGGIVPQMENVAKSDTTDNRKKVLSGDFVINSRSDRKQSCGVSLIDGSVSLINTVLYPAKGAPIIQTYLNYLLKNYGFAEEFYRWGHGIVADLWTTRWQEMKSILIPVPPMDEQRKILNAASAQIDSLIEIIQTQIERLNDYRTSVISSHTSDTSFRHLKLKRVVNNVEQGWSPSPTERKDGDDWQVLTLAAVKFGRFNAENTKPFEGNIERCKSLSISAGDFLLTRSNTKELVGQVCIVDRSMQNTIFSYLIYRLDLDTRYVYPKFMLYYFQSTQMRQQIQRDAHGSSSTMVKITHKDIDNWEIDLPDMDKQIEVAEQLNDITRKIDDLISIKQRKIEKLEQYKRSLIYEYVTGKREVI